jgi:hypothetical protein
VNRRNFIKTASVPIALGIAGCSEDNASQNIGGADELLSVSGSTNISEDEYVSWNVTGDAMTLEGSVTVDMGPNIDFIVMESTYYERYQDGDSYQYITAGSEMDTAGTNIDAGIGSEMVYIVIDNTNAGEASPPANLDDDVVTVDYDLTVTGE